MDLLCRAELSIYSLFQNLMSCRHSQRENEVRRIASVSADGRTLTLAEPLTYTHLGVSVTLPDGTVFEGRAEVGLLTRNVVVRGSNKIEWNDRIEACPEGFNTGTACRETASVIMEWLFPSTTASTSHDILMGLKVIKEYLNLV